MEEDPSVSLGDGCLVVISDRRRRFGRLGTFVECFLEDIIKEIVGVSSSKKSGEEKGEQTDVFGAF